MSPKERQHRFRVIFAFFLVYLFWGSTYLGIRIAVEHIPPALLSGMRFLSAGVLLLAYCALSGRRIRLTAKDALLLLAMGVLLLTGGNMLLAYSEQYLPSGFAALIVAVVPLWVALIEGFILRGERLKGRGWIGLALGFAGLIVLLWPQLAPIFRNGLPQSSLNKTFLFSSGVLIFGSLSWSVGSIISRRSRLTVDAFTATSWEMIFGGAVNMLIAFVLNNHHTVVWTARGIGAVIYLTIFGSLVGFTAFIWLLEHVPTAKVSTYAYVNPVVAVLLGWLILHEEVNRYILAGAIVIVGAVVLVTSSKLKAGEEVAGSQLPVVSLGQEKSLAAD